MKWPMPSGWRFIVYGSLVISLVCIVHLIDEIRFESLFKLDRIPLFLPETFHHSISKSIAGNTPTNSTVPATTTTKTPKNPRQKIQIPLNCTFDGQDVVDHPPPTTCPDYFRWIYKNLRPWKETGITRDMVESAWIKSNFGVVILDGRVYMERHKKGHTSRELFTLWGILQLLRRAELHIKSWEGFLEELKGDKRWMDKEAYAHWKGTRLPPDRKDLLKCNISDKQD
ncbi:hypothetical protein RHSIM_Rhsim03G0181800 [Rhododendron simsii]|uniref:Glycosyl transferase CAP10 domain-containing protein n=1 Tax=Rhododendron simsii TaxID=118357 RepID=A0A834LUY5_RHOSS|nr:hypothetical protein RHSIM_Rhsim03G0181800 [Rhododendron simsii]